MIAYDVDRSVAALAATQSGVFSHAQALALGASPDMIRTRVRSGAWVRAGRRVYAIAGVPASFHRDLWVAHLGSGPESVISHQAAAAVHRLTGFSPGLLTLTVAHGAHPRVPGAVVHQLGDLSGDHWSTVNGLPVTTPARTLVDCAAVVRRRRLETALDDAVAARVVRLSDVGRCLAGVAGRGKPGVRLLTSVLDERGPGFVPPASELERALFAMLAAGGLPAPTRQMAFPGRSLAAGCVDAAYPDARLIIEADGRRWHTRVRDLPRDHARDHEAARDGWQTLRLLYDDIVGEPAETCELVRDIRAVRLRQLAA